jgi:hypothetical protein
MTKENIQLLIENWGLDCTTTILVRIMNGAKTDMPWDKFIKEAGDVRGSLASVLILAIYNAFPEIWELMPSDLGENAEDCVFALTEMMGVEW